MLWKRTTRFQAKKLESFHRCFISRGAWGHGTLDMRREVWDIIVFVFKSSFCAGLSQTLWKMYSWISCGILTELPQYPKMISLVLSHPRLSRNSCFFNMANSNSPFFPGMERMWLREFFTTGCSGATINEPCKSCERYLPTSVIQWLEWGWKSSPPQIYTGFVQLDFFTFTGHHALSRHLGEDFWELFPNKQTNPGRERISSYVRLLGCPSFQSLKP